MHLSIQFQVDGGVAKIVLKRPDAGNAVTLRWHALLQAALECEDKRVRAQ